MSYIGVPPFGQTVRTITELTATAGQSTFNISGGYLPGYIDVFLNGSSLGAADFTASNGSTVVLNVAAALNDEFKALAYWPVSLVDTYRKSEADARYLSSANGSVTQAKLAAGVAGNGPAFLAFQSAPTSIVSATTTKVLFGNEVFDTNSNFVSSRFTPTVAGYYQINANVSINQPGNASNIVMLFKNGVEYLRGGRGQTTSAANLGLPVAAVIYMNGSTDYVEVYFYTNNGTCDTEAGASSHFSGALIRSAT